MVPMLAPQTLIVVVALAGAWSFAPERIETPRGEERTASATLDATLSGVEQALEAGDAKAVAHYFGSKVELGCGGDDESYSRRQAEFVLRSFFRAHPPGAYATQKTQPDAAGGIVVEGRYTTVDGVVYRVDVHLTRAGNRSVINALALRKAP